MSDFKWIIRKNIPCWYELSWQEKPPAIILRIRTDFIENFFEETKAPPMQEWLNVQHLAKTFKFGEFGGNFREDIGFLRLFKNKGEKDGFITFAVDIPEIKKESEKPCSACEGSGKDKTWNEECRWCDGSGKEYDFDWKTPSAISASFTILTYSLLTTPEKDTSCSFPQLFTVETMTGTDILHAGSLGGEISIPLHKFLQSLGDVSFPEIVNAMQIAYARMFGKKNLERMGFRSHARNGGFLADCPGDACGIHPNEWTEDMDEGYKFGCHNVDSSAQQITLLVALAALHDLARKEIKVY